MKRRGRWRSSSNQRRWTSRTPALSGTPPSAMGDLPRIRIQEERRGRLRQRACRALALPRALRRPDSKREQGRAGACESRASASASDGAYCWIARASMLSSRASSATSATRFNMKRRKSRGCGPRAGSGNEGEWRPDHGEPVMERGS